MRIRNSAAAKLIGVTTRTLRRWDEDPEVGLPPPRIIKGRIYRDRDEVIAFLKNNPGFGAQRASATQKEKEAQ